MAASSPFTPPPARPLPPSGLVGREREQQRLGALLSQWSLRREERGAGEGADPGVR